MLIDSTCKICLVVKQDTIFVSCHCLKPFSPRQKLASQRCAQGWTCASDLESYLEALGKPIRVLFSLHWLRPKRLPFIYSTPRCVGLHFSFALLEDVSCRYESSGPSWSLMPRRPPAKKEAGKLRGAWFNHQSHLMLNCYFIRPTSFSIGRKDVHPCTDLGHQSTKGKA